LPEFVTVMVDAALVIPNVWFPKGTGFGATPTLASTPVPFSVVCCGVPGASSATFTVAVRAPVVVGVNVTLITHAPPFAVSTKFATHVVVPGTIAKSPGFVPVIVTGAPAVSVAAKLPEFVTVMVCAALVVPCFWFPKGTGFGATPTLASTPVPVSGTELGLDFALLVTVANALFAPTLVGEKLTPNVQLEFAPPLGWGDNAGSCLTGEPAIWRRD
jgi:hypothetical protein